VHIFGILSPYRFGAFDRSVKKNMPGTLFFFWAFNQFRVYVRT